MTKNIASYFYHEPCKVGINIKVVQNVLGHADFSTTMNIYTDVTKEMKQREFGDLESKLKE